jgi:hypothetical protein
MSEEKKETSGCSTSGCCKGVKLLIALLIGAFIFASGMWFAKSHCHCCHHMGEGNYCPFSAPQAIK